MAKSQKRSTPSSKPLHLMLTAVVAKDLVPFLRRHLRAAHQLLRPALTELSVALVGDKRMSDLHEQFMGIPGPTDVLTFPLDEDDHGRITSGEVVVCVPEARRRAKVESTDPRNEVLLYALHGMLHLCGYDDRTASGFKAMHQAEDQILSQLGIGTVFAKAQTKAATPALPAATSSPGKRLSVASKRSQGKGLRRKC